MSLRKTHSIEVPLTMDSFQTADSFIEEWMKQNRISEKSIVETKLLFEAQYNNLIDQGFDENTMLTIRAQKTFGEYIIRLGFEGEAYVPSKKVQNDLSPELSIVNAYNDKVGYRYRLGYNSIRIVVKRNYRSSLLYCAFGILLAILVYLPLQAYMSAENQIELNDRYILPLMNQFANAMLMVGAPVTFFSLVKNLADIYILSEKSSSGRELQIKTIVTSIISIMLALGSGVLIGFLVEMRRGYLSGMESFSGGMSVSQFISSLIPNSIFEPFETYMPFPIIIVALLLTYALCSVSEHFDTIQKMINVGFSLFSKMLNVIIFTLPFFCFLAILKALLSKGFTNLLVILEFVVLVSVSLVTVFLFYLIRLLLGGVKIGQFIKRLPPLIWENFKINSAIEAVPFNIRYCSRKYGYDRKRLSAKLPILAQTNQDGNCYLITLISMVFIFLLGIEISWFQIVGIAVLILFLSIGAPNQPGSIMVGILIISFYLGANDLVSIAIFAEVFFGALQNVINVIGDIVTVAIEEQKVRQKAAA